MELREALEQISVIREQIARTEVFRGYRSSSVAFSAAVAVLAAVVQARWLPEPLENVPGYLAIWISGAAISVAVVGAEMAIRARRSRGNVARRLTSLAVEQFLPCLAVGAVLTAVVARRAVESAWMLPGLWAMLFSLGVFASFRLLPRAAFWIGVYYLVAGVLNLTWAQGEAALSPWSMGLTFGGGQFLSAAILYFTLEQFDHERPV